MLHVFLLSVGDSFSTVIIPPNQQFVDIADLVTYTPYTIDIAAMTIKGLGPDRRIHIWTSESSRCFDFQISVFESKTPI